MAARPLFDQEKLVILCTLSEYLKMQSGREETTVCEMNLSAIPPFLSAM